ncbi:MAG: nucleotidyltransferase domain-containing protein [Candidatus Heimdallarchaeaceae archaeon]
MKESKKVNEAILFGSIARGDYGLYSDADILIILEENVKKRFFDRILEFIDFFLDSPVPVDIFPYTTREIERMKKDNFFIQRVLNKGIKL